MSTESPRDCAYFRGEGKCTQVWRGCGLTGEPRCISDEMVSQEATTSTATRSLEPGASILREIILQVVLREAFRIAWDLNERSKGRDLPEPFPGFP